MIRRRIGKSFKTAGRQVFLCLLILTGIGCGGRDDPDPVLAELPMLYAEQADTGGAPWVVVPLTIGSQEYKFVIDTCCSSTTFDRSLRSVLGPTVGTMLSNRNLSDATVKVERCRVPKDFHIGHLALTGVVECLDLAAVEGRKTPYPHEGIIGMDVLDGKVLHLDLIERRVRLLRTGTAIESSDPNRVHSVPLSRDHHRFAVVPVGMADDLKEPFLLDTGMLGANWLRSELFDQLKDRPGFRVIPSENAEMMVATEIRIGDLMLPDMAFVRGARSILGTACLVRFRTLTLDLQTNQLDLEPREQSPPAPPH